MKIGYRKFQFVGAVASMLVFSSVLADDYVVSTPGEGWGIRFKAPKLSTVESPVPSVFAGRAERLQIAFFVEPPRCPGGDSDANIYRCFATSLQKNPLVLWDTERANTRPNGIQVMYMSKMETEKGVGKSFNINLLFFRGGKWADLHASIASPTQDDIKELFAIVDSIVIVDEPRTAKEGGR